MWRPTSIADQMPEDLSANLAQLRHSTLQRLILTSAGFYLLMQWAFSATWPALFGRPIVPIFDIVAGMYAFRGEFYVDWNGMAAAASISLLPVILVFLFMQRYFVEGIAGAVKQ